MTAIVELATDGLRCLKDVELKLSPGLTLITGGNGAGKTSLLEALFLLGRGRSFRTRVGEKLIAHGRDKLWVFGRNNREPADFGGVEITSTGGTRGRLNGATPPSLGSLAEVFPVQVIDPEIHKLVEEGSSGRRRWLDWAVFHVEHSFGEAWSRYAKALRQRNASLRLGMEPRAWDPELASLGEKLHQAREAFTVALQPYWQDAEQALLGIGLELRYARGWPLEQSLAEALASHVDRDKAQSTTSVGAHRADLHLRRGRFAARDSLSRGQQKLAAVAMTIAQLECLKAGNGLKPCLLLDDPAAELDPAHLRVFIERIKRFESQLIVTALVGNHSDFGPPEQVFHVEHGQVKRL